MAVKILVVYYSSYGHIEKMAEAIAEGVKEVSGVEVVVKRVEELLPLEVCKKNGYKLDQPAPIADPKELPKYDGIIFGTPTRFGNMAAQMKNFLDRTGGLWMEGKLIGKTASVFTSSATQHGGQEVTLLTSYAPLLHQGMIIIGLPPSFKGVTTKEMNGCGPYGASTIAGDDGMRLPTAVELNGARFQGKHVAEITKALVMGRSLETR